MGEQWLFMISHEKPRWNGPHRNAFHLLGQRLAAPASSATLVLIKTIIKKQLCILTNDVFPLSLCPFLPGLGFFSFSFFFSADLHSTYFCAFLRLRLLAVSACSVVVCLGSEHHSWLYQHMTSKWQHAVFKTLWRTHTQFFTSLHLDRQLFSFWHAPFVLQSSSSLSSLHHRCHYCALTPAIITIRLCLFGLGPPFEDQVP